MTLYATTPACWAPGLDGDADWKDWLEGRRAIERTAAMPPLSFTAPLFRRRLSQLSRMTVQVVHDALELAGPGAGPGSPCACSGAGTEASGRNPGATGGTAGTGGTGRAAGSETGVAPLRQSFVSFRGELARQLSINRSLITEQDVLPASFSLSVFNTPMALASMACGLTGGYSVLFPPADAFYDGFCAACAPLLCGEEDRLLFVYADEAVPAEYAAFCPDDADPLAFACILSASVPCGSSIAFDHTAAAGMTPVSFLRMLLRGASAGGPGSTSSVSFTGGTDCDSGSPGAGSGHRNVRDWSLSSTGADGSGNSVGRSAGQ